VSWKEVIMDSARKEFEASAAEKDPQIVTHLLLSGRDSLDQAIQKFMAKREEIIKEEGKTHQPVPQ
jgi:bisphosphoglycerate-independent phosphoglycerate mutase (AlkP superfamily)